MYRLAIFIFLFGTWIVFSGQFDAFHLTLGLVSTLFVTWISSEFLLQDRTMSLGARWRQLMKMPGYMLWLFYQILLSNIHILKLALTPGDLKGVEPSLVTVKTKLKTDFGKYVLANSITLTPGTITVSLSGDELLIHSISKHTRASALDDTMERKVADVFEGGET